MNRMTRPLNSVILRELLRSLSLRASSTKRRFSQATRPLSMSNTSRQANPLDFSTFAYRANRPSFKPKLSGIDTKPANSNSNPDFVVVAEVPTDYNNMDDASRSKGPDSSERRNAKLPEELSKNVVRLSCKSSAKGGKCDVYLVGTSHYSKARSCSGFCLESCREVEAVISYLKPQVVFLELCSSRIGILHIRNVKDIKIARLSGEIPLSEFRVAYEEANKYGARVILGDRPFHLNRTDYVDNVRKRLPTYVETLIDERDQYMSCTLLAVAGEHSSVVAVVGGAHSPGIRKHWKQPVPINELLTIPPQKPTIAEAIAIASAFAFAIVFPIAGAFAFAIAIAFVSDIATAGAVAVAIATAVTIVLVIDVVQVICL
ncbi:hypothetical protein V6N11_028132 [Hibiscus sabdariffa]|uniref:Uncharacterized protein n=1 Tax=Hibiscus sabdariffa TaxID=183260 RepID=A0ABR2P004_9ROSI